MKLDPATIGNVLKQRRLELEYTQGQIAHATGRSRATISLIETGKQIPSLEFLAKATELLRIDLEVTLRASALRSRLDEAIREDASDGVLLRLTKKIRQAIPAE